MRAALHRSAKKENHRRGAAARASAHASRWADDELAEHAPRPPRLRAERRAWQRPLSGRSRVGQACHYGYDAHGNVAFLTDATGAVTDSYDYDAWGNLVAQTGSTANTRLYAGEEFDPDLGLMNLRARLYKPMTGRFLSMDPVMGRQPVPTSFNRYLYGAADPVVHVDPSGLTVATEYTSQVAGTAAAATGPLQITPIVTRTVIEGTGVVVRRRLGAAGAGLLVAGGKLACALWNAASVVEFGATAEGPCNTTIETCSTVHPGEPICNVAPPQYKFTNVDEALRAFIVSSGRPLEYGPGDITKTQNPDAFCTTGKGLHYNVTATDTGERAGSILCCDCCQDTSAGPFFPRPVCGVVNARSGFR